MADPSVPPSASRLGGLAAGGLPVLAAILGYLPTLNDFFLADDFFYLSQATGGHPLRHGFFRPGADWLFQAGYHLFGLRPAGYHAIQILLHAVAVGLVYRLARHWFPGTGGRWAAGTAALFFALHFRHPEAVSWISGRPDLLCAVWYLGAVLLYLEYRQRPRWPALAGSLLCFGGALLAKEMALSLPLLVLALECRHHHREAGPDWWRRHRRGAATLRLAGAYLSVLGLYLPARLLTLGRLVGGYGAGTHANPDPVTAVNGYASAWASMLIPGTLDLAPLKALAARHPGVAVPLALAGIGVLLVAGLRWGSRPLAFGIGWFSITLLPVINLPLPLSYTLRDRFVYLPSVGFCLGLAALAHGAGRVRRPAWIRGVAVGAFTLFLAAGLWQTNAHWQTASGITRSLLLEFRPPPPPGPGPPTYLFLTVPAQYRGAHISPGPLHVPLELFHPQLREARLLTVTHLLLEADSPAEPVGWEREGPILTGTAREGGFLVPGGRARTIGPHYTVEFSDFPTVDRARRVRVSLHLPPRVSPRLLHYRQGRLVPLPGKTPPAPPHP